MRRGTILSVFSFLFLAGMGACTAPKTAMFPFDAPVVDREDKSASLKPLQGRPLVVVVYASSMPDCRRRIERFVRLSASFAEKEIAFAAIDISPVAEKPFSDAFPEQTGNVLFYKDMKGVVARAMKVDIIPTTFFVSRNGKILEKAEAVHSWDSGEYRGRVEKFLKNG